MTEINRNYKNIYVSAELLMRHLIKKKTLYEKDFHEYGREYDCGVKVGLDSAIDYIKFLIGEGKIMMPNPLESRDVNV